MKITALILASALAFAPAAFAASPSSKAAQAGTNPSTVTTNDGFDFPTRDNGNHYGWCNAPGHPNENGYETPGSMAGGHRNHADCVEVCEGEPPCDE